MRNVGYYNGAIGLIEDMMIPMADRAAYFGDGVYDAASAANHTIFQLDAHMDRFFNSCRATRMPFTLSRSELAAELQKCVDLMDSDGELFVYWQCSRGTADRTHAFPTNGAPANLMITVKEQPLMDISVSRKAILAEDTRYYHCDIKTINLLPNVLVTQLAKDAGCDEAILHRGDRVTECTHCNVHILKDGVFRTAPTDNWILPGITRAHLLRICERLGIPYVEEAFTVQELLDADEVIVSSVGTPGVRICEIDGRKVGGKAPELLRKLQDAFVQDYLEETGYRLSFFD